MKEKATKIINFHFPFWQAIYILFLGFLCIAAYGINGWFQLKSVSKNVDSLTLAVQKTNDSIVMLNVNISEVRQKVMDNTDNIKSMQNGRVHN